MTDSPEWNREVEAAGEQLLARVLKQATVAGIKPPAYLLKGVPKEWMKTLYFKSVREALLAVDPSAVMTKQRTASEYIDQVWAPRAGFKRRKNAPDRQKQVGMMSIKRTPAFTPLASHHSLETIMENVRRALKAVEDSDEWGGDPLKAEAVEEFDSFGFHSFNSPLFTCGHAAVIGGTDWMPWTPLDQNGRPQEMFLPMKYYENVAMKVRNTMIPKGQYLKPSHFLVGSAAAGGKYGDGTGVLKIRNPEGAAGNPYTLAEDARSLTSDGKRATKANTSQAELYKLVEHVKAGQPWTGKTMKALMQPATMTTRGDAKQHIDLVIFSVAMLEAGFPLAILLFSGRGIIITSGISGLAEDVIWGPWAEALNENDVKAYDLRGGRLVKEVARDAFAEHELGLSRTVSGDIARWDFNAAAGEHGLMAAHIASMAPPGKVPLLFGAASRPALWTAEQITRLQATIPIGESMMAEVEVVDPETQKSNVETVEVHHLEVDVRKMIVQAYQAVNGAGMTIFGYNVPTIEHIVPVPTSIMEMADAEPLNQQMFIKVHGTIRSGSRGTSANNSSLNNFCLLAGYDALRRLGPKSTLVRKRAKLAGLPMPTKFNLPTDGVSGFFRGDDSLIKMVTGVRMFHAKGEYDLGQKYGLIMAMTGRYGNFAKQLFGTEENPLYEFASVLYSQQLPNGITPPKRSLERSVTTEGSTSGVDRQPMSEEEAENLVTNGGRLDLGLVEDQLTAKMRLLPQAGSKIPLSRFGNPTPGHRDLIRTTAFMDKHGLVYDLEDMTPELYELIMEAEAKRFAKREALKSGADNLTVSQLEEEYKEANLNQMLVEFGQQRRGKQMPGRQPRAAERSFLERVSRVKKGENAYLFG